MSTSRPRSPYLRRCRFETLESRLAPTLFGVGALLPGALDRGAVAPEFAGEPVAGEFAAGELAGRLLHEGPPVAEENGRPFTPVLDPATGEPAPGALGGIVLQLRWAETGQPVSADEAAPGHYAGPFVETRTNDSGGYRFTGLPPGSFQVVRVIPLTIIDGLDPREPSGGAPSTPLPTPPPTDDRLGIAVALSELSSRHSPQANLGSLAPAAGENAATQRDVPLLGPPRDPASRATAGPGAGPFAGRDPLAGSHARPIAHQPAAGEAPSHAPAGVEPAVWSLVVLGRAATVDLEAVPPFAELELPAALSRGDSPGEPFPWLPTGLAPWISSAEEAGMLPGEPLEEPFAGEEAPLTGSPQLRVRGDFDGDGREEWAVVLYDGADPLASPPLRALAVDLDGDGKDEVLLLHQGRWLLLTPADRAPASPVRIGRTGG